VWEATEDLLTQTTEDDDESSPPRTTNKAKKCKTVTFIVAAPDLMDPILLEGSGKASPQVESEPDRLSEKLIEFSRIEGVSLMDKVELKSFHPLWKNGQESGEYFPYPSIAVSTDVEV